jgi:hypothetical protein
MNVNVPRWVPVSVLSIGLISPTVAGQKEAALPDLLKAASDYLVQYSQKLGAVLAEEEYVQYDVSTGQMATPRRLGADFVLLGLGDGGVAGFRDVVSIDKASVRREEDRLAGLFKKPSGSSLSNARQITDDSLRYYVSQNLHALDQPSLALEFLRKENQERSNFKVESIKKMDGAQVAIVKFTEHATPRLVPASEDAPAVGRFWIDTASGAVRQTELGLSGRSANIRVTVKYASDATTDLLLPAEMYQQIDISGAGSMPMSSMGAANGGSSSAHQGLEGRARYSKFKQIPVDLSLLK